MEFQSGKIPKSLPAKYHARVAYWDDERDIGNSILVTLVYGFHMGDGHVIGADNVKDAVQAVKDAEVCECAECVANLAKHGK
jgi:hypothetical protein